jgi:hypothetical protein
VVDEIIAKLNTLEGIEFAKDAWVNKAPDVYGVVTLSAEAKQLWADGKLVDSAWNVIVAAFVNDDDNDWVQKVQGKLEDLEAEGKIDLTHTNNREFDYETGKVRWQWIVMVYGPLTWTETIEVESTGA